MPVTGLEQGIHKKTRHQGDSRPAPDPVGHMVPARLDETARSIMVQIHADMAAAPARKSVRPAFSQPALEAPEFLNSESMVIALMAVTSSLQDRRLDMSKDDIEANMRENQDLHQKRMDELESAQRKLAKAKKSRKKSRKSKKRSRKKNTTIRRTKPKITRRKPKFDPDLSRQ